MAHDFSGVARGQRGWSPPPNDKKVGAWEKPKSALKSTPQGVRELMILLEKMIILQWIVFSQCLVTKDFSIPHFRMFLQKGAFSDVLEGVAPKIFSHFPFFPKKVSHFRTPIFFSYPSVFCPPPQWDDPGYATAWLNGMAWRYDLKCPLFTVLITFLSDLNCGHSNFPPQPFHHRQRRFVGGRRAKRGNIPWLAQV